LTSSSTEKAREPGTIVLLAVEIDETVVAVVAVADDDPGEEYDRGNQSMMNTNHCCLLTRIDIERRRMRDDESKPYDSYRRILATGR
jgi:hypothetical protein